ncbi:MAG: ribulose-phosphate 3-epimerase [Candidatus Melainabacteria bacterium]|nr:MAG: ribulose-phosphate 3-epimerase [Candidatus Melainabacteria bacterium]
MTLVIAPSILSADFSRLGSEIERAEAASADWIHVDVMDGHFVPNLTIGAPVVKSLSKMAKVPLDVHLMISRPDQYLEDFAEAGSTFITVHAEACRHLQRTLAHIRSIGKKAGVALNPATPPEALAYVIEDVDLVLIMTVNPGFGGQKFIAEVVPKITAVRQMFDRAGKPDIHISVDGGINPETAKIVTAAGANVLVAGSSIYGSKDIGKAIADLRGAEAPRTKISTK